MSTYNEASVNTPMQSTDLLTLFKQQNQLIWNKLTVFILFFRIFILRN